MDKNRQFKKIKIMLMRSGKFVETERYYDDG